MTEPRTAADILRFAIDREIEAARLYEDMARRARNESSRTMLLGLAAEEREHRRRLEQWTASPGAPWPEDAGRDLRITDSLPDEPWREDMPWADLLIYAAKKEARAMELYARLASITSDPQARRLMELLAAQEKDHKRRLEKEYDDRVLAEN